MQRFRKINDIRRRIINWLFVLGAAVPMVLNAADAKVSWQANTEDDLAGYRIYYGTTAGNYPNAIDAGNVTQYNVTGLEEGTTYYFVVTAYDNSNNESAYSTQVTYLVEDVTPPTLVSATCSTSDLIVVIFSETLDEISAEIASNYTISSSIQVQSAVLQLDGKTVHLNTNTHANGTYTLTVNNVMDNADVNNTIVSNSKITYTWNGNDETPPSLEEIQVFRNHAGDFIGLTFSEALNQTTALTASNYAISGSVTVQSVIAGDSYEKVFLATTSHTAGTTYTLTMNNLSDTQGNVISANTKSTYEVVSEDSDPPRLIAARLKSTTSLEIEFSEKVSESTAENTSNYSISPSVSVSSASLSSDGTVVTLTTNAHAAGTYSITVSNVEDNATPANAMSTEQLSYVYTVPDVTAPTLSAVDVQSSELLLLTFSEAMDQASAEVIGNYTISPSVSVISAVLNVSQKQVLLQTATHPSGSYNVYVSNVKDEALNSIVSGTYLPYTYTAPDYTAPQATSATLHGANVVEVIFSEGVERTSAETIANYSISPSITITDASLVGDDLDRVYLQTADHQPGQSYVVTINDVKDRSVSANTIKDNSTVSYTYYSVDTTPPRLVAATLEGLYMVELEFSEPLDNTTAALKSNYSITPSIAIESATLDASAKKVYLKTSVHTPGTSYTVTATGVKDLSTTPNVIESENSKVYVCASQDVAAPILKSVDLHAGGTTLELVFNEPLDATSATTISNYEIDKGISIKSITLSNAQTEVFLQTSQHTRGSYTITLNDLKDLATNPNKIETNTKMMYTYVPADATAPVIVSTTLLSSTMLEIYFSEPLDQSTVSNVANYTLSSGITIDRVILDVTMQRVILQTSEHIPGNYTVYVSGIQDGFENQIADNTPAKYTYTTEDKVAPTILSANLDSERMLIVTFSESMNQESVLKTSNYIINNNIEVEQVYASGSDRVILQTSSHAAGDYTLTVNNLKDASTNGNLITAYSQIDYTWNPSDSTAPKVTSAALQYNSLLEITFSEPVDAVESVKTSNYQINPYVEIQSAVLDASLTKVWLYTDVHETGMYTVTVVNVKDRAFTPNKIGTQNQAVYTYSPPDTVAPSISEVELKTSMSLAVTFSETVSRATAENLSNYQITPYVEITDVYLLASLNTVHIETAQHQAKTNYTLTVQNIADRSIVGNVMKTAAKKTYFYSPPDTVAPTLLSAKPHGANTLELIFSETVDQTSAENRSNYAIDPSVEVLNASQDTSRLDRVYLETTTHMPSILYTLSLRGIKDRATSANVIKSGQYATYTLSTSSSTKDNSAPYIARVEVVSATEIDVIFSEPVDKTTALKKANYIIDEGVIIKSVNMDSSEVRVRIETSAHTKERAYKFHAANIKDQATSPNVISVADQVSYILSKNVAVSKPSQSDYELSVLNSESNLYVDRDYTVSRFPEELNDAIQIKTANSDKASTGTQHLQFELQGEATVYVAYDKRIEEIPEWLSEWTATGDQIVDSRSNVYRLYSREASTGNVSIGGNMGSGDDNMYQVYVVPQHTDGSIIASINKGSYQIDHMAVGKYVYIDRPFTVAEVSDSLQGLVWIKTANEDKVEDNEELLSFVLNEPSRVYIAYDSTIQTVAKWLDDWELTDYRILDNRGATFQVYSKEFAAEEVVLGSNNAIMTEQNGITEDMMYFVLVRSLSDGNGLSGTQLPGYFTLEPNYPNPFNPETTIEFRIHKTGHVTLTIYNILGQRVKVLVDRVMEAGDYGQEIWDGRDFRGNMVASGVYFYRIQQQKYSLTKRMVLMR